MPRDDVERARNVRNALANASVSERKRRGNGFPPLPLASTPSLSQSTPRKPSSLRLTHPFDSLLASLSRALSLNASPSSPFHLTFAPFPPAITINQNRSQYLILVEWCSARTGETGGRAGGGCTFSGDRRGAAGADATMPVMR